MRIPAPSAEGQRIAKAVYQAFADTSAVCLDGALWDEIVSALQAARDRQPIAERGDLSDLLSRIATEQRMTSGRILRQHAEASADG